MRKTKIICTLGPAVDTQGAIVALLRGGMNGARFNFSHGTHESHLATMERLEGAMAATGLPAAKILDTKGPEIRIKTFLTGKVTLKSGNEFTLYPSDEPGSAMGVGVSYPHLAEEVKVGTPILIDDGLVRMAVERIEGDNVICNVLTGGPLSNNKSVNIPGVHIQLPALTEKDVGDLRFAVEHDFDYIAASFIRSAADVKQVRDTLDSFGGQKVRIISKIENQEGVDNIDEIIAASNGIMVARGDLGVEIPAAKVPTVQKRLIRSCRRAGKLVIVATQMLNSMIHAPAPTRAEVSDVANAVYEGASCVMLSGETANGEYPMEALAAMRSIAEEAEHSIDYWGAFTHRMEHTAGDRSGDAISAAITHSCCITAMDLEAKAIVTATMSGHTARHVARYRPGCDILALTPNDKVIRQLSLAWGVQAKKIDDVRSSDAMFDICGREAAKLDCVQSGDTVVIVAGVPIGVSGSTNLIKAQRID